MNIQNTYDPSVVGNTFLDLAKIENKPIDQLKLQKLIYFAHGWSFVYRDDYGLISSPFQAMPYGPVCLDIYSQTQGFGSREIPSFFTLSYVDVKTFESKSLKFPVGSPVYNHIKLIWEKYSDKKSTTLSDWTHKNDPKNPWIISRLRAIEEGKSYKELDDTQIRDYFKSLKDINENLY